MKKFICLMLAATMLTTMSPFVLAEDADTADSNKVAVADAVTEEDIDEIVDTSEAADDKEAAAEAREEARAQAYEEAVAEVDEILEIAEVANSVKLEYDDSGATETRRVIKVNYDTARFQHGVKAFNIVLQLPRLSTSSISCSSAIFSDDELNIDENSITNEYTVSANSGVARTSGDGTLFTVTINFTKNLAAEQTVSTKTGTQITGPSATGTDITDSIEAGSMSASSVTLPKSTNEGNVLACGNTGTTPAGFGWRFDGKDTLTISGHGNMDSYAASSAVGTAAPWNGEKLIKHIKIEEDGVEITSIGSYLFANLPNLEDFVLPDHVITIGEGAFSDCPKLKNVTFKSALRTIGAYAFANCTSFTSITVPDTVTTIRNGAFSGCSNVTTVQVPFIGEQRGTIDGAASDFPHIFAGALPAKLATVKITDETDIAQEAFKDCRNVVTIVVNDDIKTLGRAAFENCAKLKEFYIPSGTSVIGEGAFKNCSSATGIYLHNNITTIGASAFEGCSSLVSIDATGENIIPSKVTTINDYTFKNCRSLKVLVINDTVEQINAAILEGCTGLVTLTIPFVGKTANLSGMALNSWTMNSSFAYFFSTTALSKSDQNNVVPASVTNVTVLSTDEQVAVPPYAFANCTHIVDIHIVSGDVVYVGAFEDCAALKTLFIPKTVTEIQSNILTGARKLETLTVPFIGKKKGDHDTPDSVIGYFFGRGTTKTYSEDIEQEYNSTESEGSFYYRIPQTLKNVVILSQTTLPYGAFSNCRNIETIQISASAKISKHAFYDCRRLQSIKLPNDTQTIEDEAFSECLKLNVINIPAKVRVIGSQAFYDCEELTEAYIPDSVEIITEDTFNGAGTKVHNEGELSIMAASGLTIVSTSDNTVKTSESGNAMSMRQFANNCGASFRVATQSEVEAVYLEPVVSPLANGGISVVAGDSQKGTVYVGLYDKNKKLIKAKKVDKAEEDAAYVEFSADEKAGAVTVKAFLWDKNQKNLTRTVPASL